MKRLLLILAAACIALGAAADPVPRRVVSLIPAATEMIFAMGAGSRLIAVSSYDKFPPERRSSRRSAPCSIPTPNESCRCGPTW